MKSAQYLKNYNCLNVQSISCKGHGTGYRTVFGMTVACIIVKEKSRKHDLRTISHNYFFIKNPKATKISKIPKNAQYLNSKPVFESVLVTDFKTCKCFPCKLLNVLMGYTCLLALCNT